ncbi:hypothetical protein CPB85DRAFT_115250 [Mucidula mucida]|nr:hypothetical protein CPB85DRAFT_115250 [Mucidula mucida]
MYGRGGAGARRRVVKPAKSEPNLKDSVSRKKSFKLSANWVPKLPSSPEPTPTPSLYDMPWDGQPRTPRTGASFASSTSTTPASSPFPRTPSDGSPMAAQRDHFLSNLWRSKKSREPSSPSSPSLSPNTSPMRSTFSLSRQYTASSTTSSSQSYPYSYDDTTSVSSHGTALSDIRFTLPAFDIEKPGFMEEIVIPLSSKTVVVEGSKSEDVAQVMHKLRLLK